MAVSLAKGQRITDKIAPAFEVCVGLGWMSKQWTLAMTLIWILCLHVRYNEKPT